MARAAPVVAVVGGGPAGLMAAEVLSAAGVAVTVFDRMPSVGRKLLMAGRGGLNLTHSEGIDAFLNRYEEAAPRLGAAFSVFGPQDLIAWSETLGQPTFVGTSGRVFPRAMKASPLLRAWVARLGLAGVSFRARCEWRGWDAHGRPEFKTGGAPFSFECGATVLALGGASWPRLGSDGRWREAFEREGLQVAPFRPANCGFRLAWSDVFRARFAGAPLKGLAASFEGLRVRGEAMVTASGLEGGLVYALARPLREAVSARGPVELVLDLRPDLRLERLRTRLTAAGPAASTATRLRKAGFSPVEAGLLREAHGVKLPSDPGALAGAIKVAPLTLIAPQGLDRAISTAGGVDWSEVDEGFELKARPGVFVAGEMLDWEAPTGGYLLQAAFSTGAAAGRGVLRRLGLNPAPRGAASA